MNKQTPTPWKHYGSSINVAAPVKNNDKRIAIKQRPPAYGISITFKLEDLDLIDQARMSCDADGRRPTYRHLFLAGCRAVLENKEAQCLIRTN